MDHPDRLILRIVWTGVLAVAACVLLLLPLKAHAIGAVTPEDTFLWDHVSAFCPGSPAVFSSGTSFRGTIGAAQAAFAAGFATCSNNPTTGGTAVQPYICRFITNSGGFTICSTGRVKQATCPANSLVVGAGCQCASGFQPNPAGTACVPDPGNCAATLGKPLGSPGQELAVTTAGRVVPAIVCKAGCQYIPTGAYTDGLGSWGMKDGVWTFFGDSGFFLGNGVNCTGADPYSSGTPENPPQPVPVPLNPGSCPGSVNGVAVPGGVPCDTTGSNSGSSAAPPTTASSPAGAPPGGRDHSTETTCTGNTCTTTDRDSVNNPDGTTTTEEETRNESKDEFCANNPGDPNCKDRESAFGGSCGGFSCTGDAVQCAMAQEQHRRACEFFEPSGAAVELGLSQSGAARGADHPGNNQSITSFSGQLDRTDRLGGSCPGDRTFNLHGQVLTLPFTKACDAMSMLGSALVALSLLIAVGIVFKGNT